MALGGCGVISVLSNILPEETNAICSASLAGDYETASALQRKVLPLIDLLFCEVNPIPVKAAMHYIGYDCGGCRLPLTDLTLEHQKQMREFFA
jgi:4-hydroxy-tetrahydrodipicolinate synthase